MAKLSCTSRKTSDRALAWGARACGHASRSRGRQSYIVGVGGLRSSSSSQLGTRGDLRSGDTRGRPEYGVVAAQRRSELELREYRR